jgi:hypothetical protein
MFKQRIIKIMVSLAPLLGAADSAGFGADSLGLAATSPVYDCGSGGSSGGGC